MKQTINKSPTYIRIESPLIIRRDLLKSALYTVKILKSYRKFTSSKQDKEKERSKLFKILRETNKTIREFKKTLPVIKGQEPKEEDTKRLSTSTRKPRETKSRRKPASKHDSLKQDLFDIESKLKELEI